jgi:hypothetical protein
MSLTEYDPLTKELPSWLYSQIRDNYDMDEQTARLLVETGRILPVLDGLDEMDSDLLTPDLAIATLGEIDRYVVGREFGAILACREDEWARIISLSKPLLGGSLTQAALVRIQPLDCHQIVGYISENIRRRSLDPTAWAGVLRQLAKQPNGVITDALSRPLWLYLAMLALGEDPRPLLDAEEVADLRGQLLSDFIPAATALLSIPGHQRRYYSDVQVSSWLETLSCSTEESSGKARGDRAIVPDQLWRIVGLRKIRIYHLIATSVMLLAFSLLVLPTAVRSAHEFILSASAGAPHRHAVELIFLIFYCLLPLSALVGVLRYSAEASVKSIPIGRVRWRRFSLRMPARVNLWHWFIRELKASFGSNIPSKLLTGAILFFPFGLAAVIEGGFVISSILDDVGLGIVLAMAMTAWYLAASGVSLLWGAIRSLSPAELTMSKARRPYDVIRADRLAGLAASLIAIAGTIGHSSFNISKVLLSLCAAAAVFMLVARVTIRYYLALVSLSVSGKLPPCLMRFLNWSVSAGLLRDAGAAYEFRHAELQRWLAERVDR